LSIIESRHRKQKNAPLGNFYSTKKDAYFDESESKQGFIVQSPQLLISHSFRTAYLRLGD